MLLPKFVKRWAATKPVRQRRIRTNQHHLTLETLETRVVFSVAPLSGGQMELPSEQHQQEPALEWVAADLNIDAESTSTRAEEGPDPVLLVISNQDFWYQDYADTRATLEAQGLEVVVAAATTETARPHANSGQGADGGFVTPDLALADVEADDYSAIVFSGGWGMAQYQYGFDGLYDGNADNRDSTTAG